jgi:hypothetical protein
VIVVSLQIQVRNRDEFERKFHKPGPSYKSTCDLDNNKPDRLYGPSVLCCDTNFSGKIIEKEVNELIS